MPTEDQPGPGFDTSVAHPARVYDYWLGGTDNFPADREAAERVLAVTPGLRFRVRANRAFLARAVATWPATGIRQFLDMAPWAPYRNRGTGSRLDAVPAGSYLAISHPASDIQAGQAEAQRRYNERVSTPQTLRTHAEVCRFFDGLSLVPPGIVYVHTWRTDPDDVPEGVTSAHGGVGRKP